MTALLIASVFIAGALTGWAVTVFICSLPGVEDWLPDEHLGADAFVSSQRCGLQSTSPTGGVVEFDDAASFYSNECSEGDGTVPVSSNHRGRRHLRLVN